ncbi:UNVERIFIED_CONTAM: hypothetical protein FKN15_018700 [Acipenser sinensis]
MVLEQLFMPSKQVFIADKALLVLLSEQGWGSAYCGPLRAADPQLQIGTSAVGTGSAETEEKAVMIGVGHLKQTCPKLQTAARTNISSGDGETAGVVRRAEVEEPPRPEPQSRRKRAEEPGTSTAAAEPGAAAPADADREGVYTAVVKKRKLKKRTSPAAAAANLAAGDEESVWGPLMVFHDSGVGYQPFAVVEPSTGSEGQEKGRPQPTDLVSEDLLPTEPVAGQPVVPPPVPHVQPQEVWDVDAVSRDASDAEPLFKEGTEPEVASQHSEQDDPEVLDTNDPMWSVVERAARHLGVDWPASEPTRRSLFELPSAHTLQSRILPAFPDFIKEVQSTWGAPASTPATSRKAAAFNMHGASEAGLASFPPVGAAFAALVKAPTLSGLAKDPSCPNRQCRITEAHLKKGYAAATEAVRLSNVASLLTVYQAALLRDLPECPSAALRTELGTVAQLLVKLAQLNARAQGRSIASLVVARRQLWLSQARVQEPDKVPLLDAPISPGHTFGPAVEEMLQRSVKAREASQQLAKMWPSKPFQPRRPQERQWRRAPPQQQAQSRGSMTAPSGVSARGQPAFVRPQRGGWRPRGGGKPRPRGSGQAPLHRTGARSALAGEARIALARQTSLFVVSMAATSVVIGGWSPTVAATYGPIVAPVCGPEL